MFHELLAGWGLVRFWVYALLKLLTWKTYGTFSYVFVEYSQTEKDVKQCFDVVWPWFQYILPAQTQVWVRCDPVTRVKALNWQDLDHKFPFSMAFLSLPLERVSWKTHIQLSKSPLCPASQCQGQTLKLLGSMSRLYVASGEFGGALNFADAHFQKETLAVMRTKVECKPSGWNLLGRWNPKIQPKAINKKRWFSDVWFDMHWSNFRLSVF